MTSYGKALSTFSIHCNDCGDSHSIEATTCPIKNSVLTKTVDNIEISGEPLRLVDESAPLAHADGQRLCEKFFELVATATSKRAGGLAEILKDVKLEEGKQWVVFPSRKHMEALDEFLAKSPFAPRPPYQARVKRDWEGTK